MKKQTTVNQQRDDNGRFAPMLRTKKSAKRYMQKDAKEAQRRAEMIANGEDPFLWA